MRTPLCLVVASLVFASCSASPDDAADGRYPVLEPNQPLPRSSAESLGIEPWLGGSVVAQAAPVHSIPDHPFLDNNGNSRIHNDHYNSGTYNRSGPAGPELEIMTHRLGDLVGVCAELAILKSGYVLGSCFVDAGEPLNVDLVLLDDRTLDVVARQTLGTRPFKQSSAGGAYFSVDAQERIVVGPATNQLETWHIEVHDGVPGFVQDSAVDLVPYLPAGSLLQDTVLDTQGRAWFMADTGVVGLVDGDAVLTLDLSADLAGCTDAAASEVLQNSMAVDDSGMYLATCSAIHKLRYANGEVQDVWRAVYDSDGPGLLGPGTGSSVSLFGLADDLVSVADNAAEQIHLLVLERSTGDTVCKIPLFEHGASATENSSIATGDDVVVANNAGFGGVFAPANTMVPGLERYTVRADRSGCDPVWSNNTSLANSAQLATHSGVIWGYGADPDYVDEDVFYVVAHSWHTGEEIFRAYVGDGRPFDPLAGQVHVHPDGPLFLGTLEGVVLMRDPIR